MYLMILSQGDNEIELGLFETLEEGRSFAAKLPGYKLECEEGEEGYIYESMELAAVPEYMELEHNGNIIPLSKFTFVNDEDIDIFWKDIPVLSNKGTGFADGITRIDAYVVENYEVKEYIERREAEYNRIKTILENMGCEVGRDFFGSEDGEALVYRKNGESEWHILDHIVPEFLEEYTEEEIAKSI